MNIYRKIQLTAAVVVANGALALGILSPSAAVAASCLSTKIQVCLVSNCPNPLQVAQICRTIAPPNCTYVGSICRIAGQCGGFGQITCVYH